jgi:S1-C subfamily serine protease
MKKIFFSLIIPLLAVFAFLPACDAEEGAKTDVVSYLQDISVTVHANGAMGSGVVTNVGDANWVWTAAHVVDELREAREVTDPKTGGRKTVVTFKDAKVVKDIVEEGRTIGQIWFYAEVVRYSDFVYGEDLALLKVRKKNFTDKQVKFYLDKSIPALGSKLYHVGSPLGQFGSGSFTSGDYSQVGRLLNGKIYDQTSVPIQGGDSGSGVYLTDGRYIGMVVRGADATFNLVVPVRRMHDWAKKVGVDFTMNPEVGVPTDADLRKLPIEDVDGMPNGPERLGKPTELFKYLIYK